MSELPGIVAPSADLVSRSDVHDLVVEFYREVVFDEVLEPVFGEVAEVDWAAHIPRLVDSGAGSSSTPTAPPGMSWPCTDTSTDLSRSGRCTATAGTRCGPAAWTAAGLDRQQNTQSPMPGH